MAEIFNDASSFVRALWSSWWTRMSGPMSVPLAIAGVVLNDHPTVSKILLGTGIVCLLQASFFIWRHEYKKTKQLIPLYCASFHEEKGSPTQFTDGHHALYFRLKVENKSSVPVEACEGWATEIYKNGKISRISAAKLTWVGATASSPTNITLRPMVPRLLDISFVRDDGFAALCTENLVWPVDQKEFFGHSNNYKFKVVVSASNSATPPPIMLEWKLSKSWKASRMKVVL
jgi:hypothetical protein